MKSTANIILIGGAATTGKTTVAEQLSRELGLPWISTDQIRSMIKSVAEENHYPDLFKRVNDEDGVEEIVDQDIKISEVIWRGVRALIEGYYPWSGCIIEGVAILPHLVSLDFADRPEIKVVFLVHANSERIEKAVFERSKLPFIKTKTEAQQESRVKQIKLLNNKIQTDAEAFGFTIIDAHTNQTFDDVMKVLV